MNIPLNFSAIEEPKHDQQADKQSSIILLIQPLRMINLRRDSLAFECLQIGSLCLVWYSK
jgi:hypothetical protein